MVTIYFTFFKDLFVLHVNMWVDILVRVKEIYLFISDNVKLFYPYRVFSSVNQNASRDFERLFSNQRIILYLK